MAGTISSSGATKAIDDYWEYYEPIRIYAPQRCVSLTQRLVNVMDNIFMKYSNTTEPAKQLKALFGLGGVEYVYRFIRIVTFDLERGTSDVHSTQGCLVRSYTIIALAF